MAKTETRRINIWINGKEVQNNIKDISAAYKKLIAEQAHMTVGSKEYMAHAAKIKQLKGSIDEHKRQIGSIATAWQKAKDTIVATGFGVLGGNMLTALTTRIGGFFNNIITGATKMADQFSDIRKTTGMTMEEVEALSGSLSKIDTRTSTSDLREMAIVAGQLGIAKDEVLGFVEAVDKTAVALGDEFTGGADEVAATVGKLRNVFGDIKTDDVGSDIMHISNALNELGAAGFATSPVVADFANRIGGVGITLGLTSGQVLGLSATLQELNVSTERGGTAVVKILQKMTTETDKFAVIAGMSVTDFKNLVNTDLYGAFTKVMEGSKRSGTSATALAGIIKDLEIQGAGASEVFAKLGGNVAMLNEKVDLASTSLLSTDSVMNEFNLKNENLAGQWEKTKKTMNSIVMGIGKQLAPAILSIVKGFVSVLEWVKRNSQAFIAFGKVIASAVIGWVTYISLQKMAVLWSNKLYLAKLKEFAVEKAKQVSDKIGTALMALRILAYDAYTKKITMATAATRLFNLVSKASGVGLLVAGIVAAVSAMSMFNKETEKTQTVQQQLRDKVAEETAGLQLLKTQILDSNTSAAERARLIGVVNEQYGQYLPNLLSEKMTNQQLATALNDVNKQLERKIMLEMRDANNKAIIEKIVKAKMDLIDAEKKLNDFYNSATTTTLNKDVWDLELKRRQDMVMGLKVGIEVMRVQIQENNALFDSMLKDSGLNNLTPLGSGDNLTPETPLSEEGANKQKELKKKYIDIYQQLQDKIKEMRRQLQLDDLSEQDKELQKTENKFEDLFKINSDARAEIAKLGSKADKEDLETYAKLEDQRKVLTELKEAEIAAIKEKWAKKTAEKRAEVEEQIRVALLSADEKEEYDITKKYQALIKLAQEYGFDTVELYKKMQEELDALKKKNKGGGEDILGFTPEEWDSLFSKFDALGQAMSYASEIAQNSEEAYMQQLEKDYNRQSEWLDEHFEKKRMNEETYNFLKKKYEDEYEAKKIEIQRRQVKREKDIKTYEAVISLAKNIVEAGVVTPQALLIAALGALQIAAIRSEPLPQFSSGGFTAKSGNNMQPAGTVHANEWVSPAWMVKDPVTGPVISQLEAIRSSGNARGGVSVPQMRRNMAQQGSGDISAAMLKQLVSQNAKLLTYMSDPDNRRAIIVHDTYTKYQQDIAEMQKLRKIS